MAGQHLSSTTKLDIERAINHIDRGLRALHALAIQHENAVTGETLSICVEQMALEMLVKVQQLTDIMDQKGRGQHA